MVTVPLEFLLKRFQSIFCPDCDLRFSIHRFEVVRCAFQHLDRFELTRNTKGFCLEQQRRRRVRKLEFR